MSLCAFTGEKSPSYTLTLPLQASRRYSKWKVICLSHLDLGYIEKDRRRMVTTACTLGRARAARDGRTWDVVNIRWRSHSRLCYSKPRERRAWRVQLLNDPRPALARRLSLTTQYSPLSFMGDVIPPRHIFAASCIFAVGIAICRTAVTTGGTALSKPEQTRQNPDACQAYYTAAAFRGYDPSLKPPI